MLEDELVPQDLGEQEVSSFRLRSYMFAEPRRHDGARRTCTYLERKTGLTLEKLRALAVQVTATHIEQGSKTYWQRSELPPDFVSVLKVLDIDVPAIVWSEWIEPGQKPKKRKAGAS